MQDGDAGKGIHPLDPRAAQHATKVIDPLMFCPECGSDQFTEHSEEDYVTFTDTKETARAAICTRCRIMWTERTKSGKELRFDRDGGRKGKSISIPGAPVRPYTDPRRDPRLISTGPHAEDPRVKTMRVQLRRDIDYYAACRVPNHIGCRCHEIESTWSRLLDS